MIISIRIYDIKIIISIGLHEYFDIRIKVSISIETYDIKIIVRIIVRISNN